MTLREMRLPELKRLHETELREAFPPQELKPYAAMKTLYEKGVYHPVGAWEGERLVGYAILWESPAHPYVLIDYLGVPAHLRERGPGRDALGPAGGAVCRDGRHPCRVGGSRGRAGGRPAPPETGLLPPQWIHVFGL